MTTVVVESPGRDSKKRRRVQWHCPRAPTPEPGKGRRPKNRHSSKAKRVSALVYCLLPVLACLCRGFPGSGSLVLWPCSFGFLLVFVPPDVSFYWPRASRSSSRREGRRVKRRGTDPRTGPFQVSLTCVVLVFVLSHPLCVVYFILLLAVLVYHRSRRHFPRCKSVHREGQAISIFSCARVLPGDWDPIAPGRRLWMTTRLLRQRPLSLFMQHVTSTSAFCTA